MTGSESQTGDREKRAIHQIPLKSNAGLNHALAQHVPYYGVKPMDAPLLGTKEVAEWLGLSERTVLRLLPVAED
jgi:hypothetical protein